MSYDIGNAEFTSRAQSLTDGAADYRYFLWIPDFLQDSEEKDYLVLFNTGDSEDCEFKTVYQFKGDYCREKNCFAISNDGKTAVVGYKAKKGVVCYDCESGKMLWNNTSVKKVVEVRFNNFEPSVIEVTDDKLNRFYLDRDTGEPLGPDKAANIRQVIFHMCVSKNGKYLITDSPVVPSVSKIDKGRYTVYDTEAWEIKGAFAAQDNVGACTFDISDDGELAVCAAYQKQGISLIKVSSGEVIWTQKEIKNISHVFVDKENEMAVTSSRYDGIFFLDLKTGDIKKQINGEELFLNLYGEDILFKDRKTALIGNKKIVTPTFSWLGATGVKGGIILRPAGEAGLRLYSPEGELIWQNDLLRGKPAYQPDDDLIIAYSSGRIITASAKDGKIIGTQDVDAFPCAYLNRKKALLCSTGKLYEVSGDSVQELSDPVALVAGR